MKQHEFDEQRTKLMERAVVKNKFKFQRKEINPQNYELFIIVYKLEQLVEVWVRNTGSNAEYTKLTQYAFCKISGVLGPKRKENDFQIPEGIYHIDRFNPKSQYHVSLGVNYPNAADLILSDKKKPGKDIFLHGGCVTVGCVPITDRYISELYLIAKGASNQKDGKIPVYMFPYKMDEEKHERFTTKHTMHADFWTNLKPVYEKIVETNMPVSFEVNEEGKYILN